MSSPINQSETSWSYTQTKTRHAATHTHTHTRFGLLGNFVSHAWPSGIEQQTGWFPPLWCCIIVVQDVSRLLFGRCQTVITNSFQAPPHQKTTSTDSNSDSDPFMPSRMCVINRHNKKWMFLVTWTLKNPIEILAAPSTLIVDRGQNTKPGGAVYANDWVFQKSPTISANLGQSSIYMQINQHEIHYNRQDLEKSRLNVHWNNYFS